MVLEKLSVRQFHVLPSLVSGRVNCSYNLRLEAHASNISDLCGNVFALGVESFRMRLFVFAIEGRLPGLFLFSIRERLWVRIFSTGAGANDFAKLIAVDLSGSITSG